MYIVQWLTNEGDFVLQGTAGNVWDNFGCHNWKRNTIDIFWVETKDSAEHGTMHCTLSIEIDIKINISNAKKPKKSLTFCKSVSGTRSSIWTHLSLYGGIYRETLFSLLQPGLVFQYFSSSYPSPSSTHHPVTPLNFSRHYNSTLGAMNYPIISLGFSALCFKKDAKVDVTPDFLIWALLTFWAR